MTSSGPEFTPLRYQPALPLDHFIHRESPGEDAVPLDVVFVGAGPAGLAGAIRLAQLAKSENMALEIGVMEKAADLGGHCLSGAVVNPVGLRALFPGMKDSEFPLRKPVEADSVYLLTQTGQIKFPVLPPTMNNEGNFIASICEVVKWLGVKAEELGVTVFNPYPADALLVEGNQVVGVRTTPAGLERDGTAGSNATPGMDIAARVTVLSEGTRGSLAQAFLQWQNIGSPNPQIFALGVKELWETKRVPHGVVHTMGWPLPTDAFGGSFLYPMADNLVALGIVVGLDYKRSTLDVHGLLQQLKGHPLIAPYLAGGTLVEWGAKTIPEGGFYSWPARFHGDGLLMIGDCAGLVDVPSLKGIHYAMQSGIFAAETIFAALKADDVSAKLLSAYDAKVHSSYIRDDLYRTRNMRLAFKSGFYGGGAKASLMSLTQGGFPGGRITVDQDAAESRHVASPMTIPKGSLSKHDGVFAAGNATRDDTPSHLIVGQDIPAEVADFYAAMCPAGVYEREGEKLVVNAPNCIDCKATDVLGPRWTPREGGSGPGYKRM